MTLFRFKVILDDEKEIFRIIDIDGIETLETLHKTILKSINFTEGELATFYIDYENSDETVEIALSDLQEGENMLMCDCKIKDIFGNHVAKINYVYDFMELWSFDIEIMKSNFEPDKSRTYPLVIRSVGEAPKQSEFSSLLLDDFSGEEKDLLKTLKMRNENYFIHNELDSEDYGDEDDDEEDDF